MTRAPGGPCAPRTTPWHDDVLPVVRTSLAGNVDADVCVVGAGIAGVTTAYLLSREGASVVLLDRAHAGGGETGRTTAHLSNLMDDRLATMGTCSCHPLVIDARSRTSSMPRAARAWR